MGGNEHGDSRQSGWWAKRDSEVVVSSCRAWGNRGLAGGNGQASGGQYGATQLWFVNNEFFASVFGVQQTDTSAEASPNLNGIMYVIGNVFHDLNRQDPTKTDAWRGGFGVSRWHNAMTHYIAFNTCVQCESGLAAGVHPPQDDQESTFVWNNLSVGVSPDGGVAVRYEPNGRVWVDHNLFVLGVPFRAYWGGGYTSPSEFEAIDPTHVHDNLFDDPMLTSMQTDDPDHNFQPLPGSPAREAGAATAADGTDPFAVFQQRFGVSIAVDRNGRPRSTPYSIGAYR